MTRPSQRSIFLRRVVKSSGVKHAHIPRIKCAARSILNAIGMVCLSNLNNNLLLINISPVKLWRTWRPSQRVPPAFATPLRQALLRTWRIYYSIDGRRTNAATTATAPETMRTSIIHFILWTWHKTKLPEARKRDSDSRKRCKEYLECVRNPVNQSYGGDEWTCSVSVSGK